MNKLQLAMNAGARAIENNKRLDGSIYVYDVFSNDAQRISYREACQILRECAENNGWIPVGRELPEIEGEYKVTVCYERNGEINEIKNAGFFRGQWHVCLNHLEVPYKVTAWKLLDEPYEEE
ncbi:MAG TPA: hypothetical protein VJZ06_04920 [Mobilitalea sp.]|nr:hypothetical protein [Mobilitalea sp.]